MNLLTVVAGVGRGARWSRISPTAAFLSRFLELDPHRPTPAVELRDDLDYVPIESKFLLEPAFFGDRRGRADRRADSGRRRCSAGCRR